MDATCFGRWIAAAAAALAGAASAAATPPDTGRIAFDVLRNGKPLGSHILTFDEVDDALVVTVDVDLQVKVGPFTPFRYRHDVREVWREGRLLSLSAETLKDGDTFRLEASRQGDGAVTIDGRDYQGAAPAEVIASTWWNPEVLDDPVALNSETGELMPITVTPLGRETIQAAGRPIEAEHYRLEAALTLDLWYDDEGHWVKCAFVARGSDIEYVLAEPVSAQDAP